MIRISCLLLAVVAPVSGQVAEPGGRRSADGQVELIYENVNGGGGGSGSGVYELESSVGEAFSGPTESVGGDTAVLFGLAPQLYTASSLSIGGSVEEVDEGGAVALTFQVMLDDGTAAALDGAAVGWTGLEGLTADGTALVGRVYQDTEAVAEFSYLGATEAWFFSIKNTGNDDFGFYANDGVDDLYQFFRFGEDNPEGNGFLDKDGDGFSTLVEFAVGSDPNVAGAVPAGFSVLYDHPEGDERRVLRLRRRGDGDGTLPLTYELWGSSDLLSWERVEEEISVSDPDGSGFVEVEFRDREGGGAGGRRFYRVSYVPKNEG